MAAGPSQREVALFQPVLSHYRVDLFNAVDAALGGGLTVFTVSADADSRLDGADHRLRCRRRPSRTWRVGPAWFVPTALRQVSSRRWDAVVLSWNSRQVELLPALVLGRLRGVPVVLWGHGLGQGRSRTATILRRAQARLAAAIITYNEPGRRDVEALAPGQRVRVLLNTTGRPAPRPEEAPDHIVHRVVHLGRLIERKQVGRLLAAVAALEAEGVVLAVEVVGDGPEAPALRATAEELGIAGRVTWHGQVTEWAAARDLVRRGDVVVLPERAGLAVVDAFAAARAVVVTDDPRANPPEADLVESGRNGLRYAPPTAEGLADCLRRAYARPEGLLEMSARAGEDYRARLGLDAAAATLAAVVAEVARPDR